MSLTFQGLCSTIAVFILSAWFQHITPKQCSRWPVMLRNFKIKHFLICLSTKKNLVLQYYPAFELVVAQQGQYFLQFLCSMCWGGSRNATIYPMLPSNQPTSKAISHYNASLNKDVHVIKFHRCYSVTRPHFQFLDSICGVQASMSWILCVGAPFKHYAQVWVSGGTICLEGDTGRHHLPQNRHTCTCRRVVRWKFCPKWVYVLAHSVLIYLFNFVWIVNIKVTERVELAFYKKNSGQLPQPKTPVVDCQWKGS